MQKTIILSDTVERIEELNAEIALKESEGYEVIQTSTVPGWGGDNKYQFEYSYVVVTMRFINQE